jgi:regulatory protein
VRDKVRLNQWGRVKIRFMLGMEHLKFSIVDQALAEIDEEVYEESLKVILEKKARELARESNAYTKKQKLVKFAQGRGYETDVILKVLKEGEERK